MQSLDWAKVEKQFYLIDSFEGPVLEQFSEQEIRAGRLKVVKQAITAGAYVTDIAQVRAKFAEWPNARVVQGRVPEILKSLDIPQVAFLHIDMNCALPEQAALEYFWDRLSPGGIILFDDYVYFGNETLTKALDQTARKLGAHILSLPTGQGLILK